MMKTASFLIVLLLLFSCRIESRTNNHKSFSKRKHLKGHFWNPKGGSGKSDKKNFESSQALGNEEEAETIIESSLVQSQEPQTEILSTTSDLEIDDFIQESRVDEIMALVELETDIDDTLNSKNPEDDYDWGGREISQPRCGPGWPIIIMPAFIYLGLFFLLLYFILAAFDIILKWMLFTGIILVALPVAILLFILLVVILFY